MPRKQHSRKRHSTSSSSSFTKFVARLQHTFSYKNIKSSTPVIQQQTFPQSNGIPVISTFPSFSNSNYPRCRLSQILYDPLRQVEYLSEIEEKSNTDISEQSLSVDDNDSCYDSMSEHRNDQFNLSQMNVSMDKVHQHQYCQPIKHLKLPNSFDINRFHSTAINDISHY